MLTTAAFLGFLAAGRLDVWAVMIILTREFMVKMCIRDSPRRVGAFFISAAHGAACRGKRTTDGGAAPCFSDGVSSRDRKGDCV